MVGAPHAPLPTRVTDGGRVALLVLEVVDHGGEVGGGGLVAVPAAVAADDGLGQVRPEGLADVVVGLWMDKDE